MKQMNDKDAEKALLCRICAVTLRPCFLYSPIDFTKLQEVRLRVGQPVTIRYENKMVFLNVMGQPVANKTDGVYVDGAMLRETFQYICDYSVYAYTNEIRQGFITLQGGHRVGIGGKAVVEGNAITNIKYISFLNIRIAHSINGCGDIFLNAIKKDKTIYNTLIISPPAGGKTTLLRDLIRQISDILQLTVGVVDERSEIAACHLGVPGQDVGTYTDVLDGCPKDKGMLMLLRSMAPDVIAVDELGGVEDVNALAYVRNSGCKVIATIHGGSYEDIRLRTDISPIVMSQYFERYIVLGNEFKTTQSGAVLDARGNRLVCY